MRTGVDRRLMHSTPPVGLRSMPVAVVRVGHMRVDMMQRLVAMAVTVRTLWHRLMFVVVMPIVMPMRMFVLQRLVLMFVAVRLGQVQQHTGEHQHAARGHPAAGRAVAQHQGQRRADEGREGEHRAGARCASR